jgi:hypothetical protein
MADLYKSKVEELAAALREKTHAWKPQRCSVG